MAYIFHTKGFVYIDPVGLGRFLFLWRHDGCDVMVGVVCGEFEIGTGELWAK
jgi:hypothetical protein